MNYNFEWDPRKARSNYGKHGIRFEEAATVFRDPRALTIFDTDHSEHEDRWITMGISKKGRLLIVCHTFISNSRRKAFLSEYPHQRPNCRLAYVK